MKCTIWQWKSSTNCLKLEVNLCLNFWTGRFLTPSICLGKTIDSLTVQQWLSEERALCVKDLHISEYLCLHYYVWEDDKLWRAPDINHMITVFF